MKTTLQVMLTAVLLFAAGYFVGFLMEPKEPPIKPPIQPETHIHGWGKWENEEKPFVNVLGRFVVPQHRVCTNCGFFQGEIH